MLRNRRSVKGCGHGSCCDAPVTNGQLRAREARQVRREVRAELAAR